MRLIWLCLTVSYLQFILLVAVGKSICYIYAMNYLEFTKALNHLLMPLEIATKAQNDACPNGLLVDASYNDDTSKEITKVVTGVSLRISLMQKAIELGANAIIVHHPNGFWNSEKDKRLIERFGVYAKNLIKHGIFTFGYHMPLDIHRELGNNQLIIKSLGLQNMSGFLSALLGGNPGVDDDRCPHATGTLTKEALDKTFPKGWTSYGNFELDKEYKNIYVCSGSGTSMLPDAIQAGCEVFITGEVRESTPILAEEYKIGVIAAGHHRSEVFGVRELAKYINEHQDTFPGVAAEFIDIDNPV